ncbi:hypothetical protein GL50803_008348 [Giardia duodenalis]|uniref:Uncharacterized protein n=1 Tax=Giardia intestinalis (strain ATCC 50803 / WB clone C6) TaxID=184922 RepID=A8BNP4_GIAIC|nr:hypothetical protein GL50803_008348 [Giardia intestinalis]KAE8302487.1 hypothetical protein GL50803_008348 [Giardia intestinalis]|eukprot:XP_001705959.1 Hypothetical protein GL50803_8348 [Giardia lamblia ATCC 50803]
MPANEHCADLISRLLYLRSLQALYINRRVEKTVYMKQINDLFGIPGSQEGPIQILLKSLKIGTLSELRRLLKNYEIDCTEISSIEYILLERKVVSGEYCQKVDKNTRELLECLYETINLLTPNSPLSYDQLLTYGNNLVSKAKKLTDGVNSTWPVLKELEGLVEQIEHEANLKTNICPADLKSAFAERLKSIYDKIFC